MFWPIVGAVVVVVLVVAWWFDRRHHGGIDEGRVRGSLEQLQKRDTPGSRRNNGFDA